MKYIVITTLFISTISFAQEGMWIPSLLEANEKEMIEMGFQLTAEDVYSVNEGSMKDAVVRFGGGCTGEVISDQGLVLTNHHCGFGSIRNLSSVDNNYLQDGFWAASMEEEMNAPGLEVMFVVSMEDVTSALLKEIDGNPVSKDIIDRRKDSIVAFATMDTHYGAYIQDFYYGNQYFMFVTETFKDIRLVGTPPRAIGEFGGETDNWIWPRHTGDFSLWRIYAGPDNLPAEYSEDNQPYSPRYHFPISLDGIKDGDFTMVFGFPGRTEEYLPALAVKNLVEQRNPNRIALREMRIRTMEKYMRGNDTLSLMYASKVKGLANAYKKWQGESLGLQANNAVDKKLAFEQEFNNSSNSKYTGLTQNLNELYVELSAYDAFMDHTIEAVLGVEAIRYARGLRSLNELTSKDSIDKDAVNEKVEELKGRVDAHFDNYYLPIDRDVFPLMMQAVHSNVDSTILPDFFNEQVDRYNSDFTTWANAVYNSSSLVDADKMKKLLDKIANGSYTALSEDPMYQIYDAFLTQYLEVNNNSVGPLRDSINSSMKLYLEGIIDGKVKQRIYPDANSTLRVAYGKVKGYTPRNGVYYKPQTTHIGIIEKHKSGDEEFEVPQELLDLFTEAKSTTFGKYANSDGELPVAFLASNHTTGGNSGSPVLNAKGELIGTNFDRVWEGTMSDIMYDFDRCRNISVDIRYTMFIIEHLGKAEWVIDEIMK